MADSSPSGAGLPRPLSIGEILDRAIATYVRRCLPLFVILAIVIVPVALVNLAAAPGFAHTSDIFAEMNRLPPADAIDRNRLLLEALGSVNPGSIFVLFVLWPLLVFPLTRNAVYAYADAALDNSPVTIARVYRESLVRWVPQMVVAIGYFALAVAAGLAAFVLFLLVASLVFVLAGRGTGAGIALLILAIPFALALWLGFALGDVAFEQSGVSVALEETNPFRAMGNGWRRTFDRSLRRRTIGVALAFAAVEVVGSLTVGALSVLVQALTHVALLQALVSAAGQIVISGVLGVFMVAYARDVRLRREGYDLLRAASEPVSAT